MVGTLGEFFAVGGRLFGESYPSSTGGRTASVVQDGVGARGRQKYIFMLEPCAGPRCNRDDNEYKDVIIKVGNNQM